MEPTKNSQRYRKEPQASSSLVASDRKQKKNKMSAKNVDAFPTLPREERKNRKPGYLKKIENHLFSKDPASTIPLCAGLNNTMLADGITSDERLISVESHYNKSVSVDRKTKVSKKNNTVHKKPPSTQSSKRGYFDTVFGAAKKVSLSRPYRYFLDMCCTFISKQVSGIQAEELNHFLTALNETHMRKKPHKFHVGKLTLPIFGSDCEITNADMIFHEVSAPDPEKGYRHIHVKMGIRANIKYRSGSGQMVSAQVNLESLDLDLNFRHERVIQKLLTSGNLATTAIQLCGSTLYPYLPALPGANRIKQWFGRANPAENNQEEAPSLRALLLPESFSMQNTKFLMTLQKDHIPAHQATIETEIESLGYDFSEKPAYLSVKGLRFAVNGNHCGTLLPTRLKNTLKKQIPSFYKERTQLSCHIPDMVIKNQKNTKLAVIPEVNIESKGDIDIEGGKIKDIRAGFFTTESGSRITAIKMKKISADRADISKASLSLPVGQQGSFKADNVNMTLVSPPTLSGSGVETVKEEAQTILQKIKNFSWGIFKAADEDETIETSKVPSETEAKLMTLSAGSIERSYKTGSTAMNARLHGFGMLVDGDKSQVHVKAKKLESAMKNPPFMPGGENGKVDIKTDAQAEDIHFTTSFDPKQAENFCTIKAKNIKADVDGPTKIKNARLQSVELKVDQTSDNEYACTAILASPEIENISPENTDASIRGKASDININAIVQMGSKKSGQVMEKANVCVNSEAMTAILTHDVDKPRDLMKNPVSLLDGINIVRPQIHLELEKGTDGKKATDILTGNVAVQSVEIKGKAGLEQTLPNHEQIMETCEKLKEHVPDSLKVAFEEEINRYHTKACTQRSLSGGNTRLVLEKGAAGFKMRGKTLQGTGNIERAKLKIEEGPAKIEASVNGIALTHNTDGKNNIKSSLDIREVRMDRASFNAVKITPERESASALKLGNLCVRHKKDSVETVNQLAIGEVLSEAKIESGDNVTPVFAKCEDVELIQTVGKSGQDTYLHVGQVQAKSCPKINEKALDASLLIQSLIAISNNEKKTGKQAVMVQKAAVKTQGLASFTAVLKNFTGTASSTDEGIKVSYALDDNHSEIHVKDIMPIAGLVNQGTQSFPVKLSITPDFHDGGNLSGNISIKCKGNLGEIIDYFRGRVASKRIKMVLSVAHFFGRFVDFKIQVNKLPIREGRILVNDISRCTYTVLKSPGQLVRVLSPLVSLVKRVSIRKMTKELESGGEAGKSGDNGRLSITELLEKYRIYFVSPERQTEFSIPDMAPPVQAANACMQLRQPLPDSWNKASFMEYIVRELKKTYGEKSEFEADFTALAEIFFQKYHIPVTMQDFEKMTGELEKLKSLAILYDKKKSPMFIYGKE